MRIDLALRNARQQLEQIVLDRRLRHAEAFESRDARPFATRGPTTRGRPWGGLRTTTRNGDMSHGRMLGSRTGRYVLIFRSELAFGSICSNCRCLGNGRYSAPSFD